MTLRLPTVEDFTLAGKPEHDLDGFSAWRAFGGLSLEAAYEAFCECPDALQEHFMWMGNRAFAFYFPVIERYLHDEEPRHEFDGVAWVLARCVAMQLPGDEQDLRGEYDRIRGLCTFVLRNLEALPERADRGHSISEVRAAWRELEAKVA